MDEDKIGSVLGIGALARRAVRGAADRQADRLDVVRPARRAPGGVQRYGLQQIYFPPITNILAEDGVPGEPVWFGVDKRALSTEWPSWLTLLRDDRGRQRGCFRPAAADRLFRPAGTGGVREHVVVHAERSTP